MKSLAAAEWSALEALRGRIGATSTSPQISAAAQVVCELFTESFESVMLARLFLVLPFDGLPARETAFARRLVDPSRPIPGNTRILCFLGTSGTKPAWRDRTTSVGHLAI